MCWSSLYLAMWREGFMKLRRFWDGRRKEEEGEEEDGRDDGGGERQWRGGR